MGSPKADTMTTSVAKRGCLFKGDAVALKEPPDRVQGRTQLGRTNLGKTQLAIQQSIPDLGERQIGLLGYQVQLLWNQPCALATAQATITITVLARWAFGLIVGTSHNSNARVEGI